MPNTENGSTSPNSRKVELAAAITQTCLTITESYRTGSISKTATILQLQAALPGADGSDTKRDTHVAALESYVITLDGFDRLR